MVLSYRERERNKPWFVEVQMSEETGISLKISVNLVVPQEKEKGELNRKQGSSLPWGGGETQSPTPVCS